MTKIRRADPRLFVRRGRAGMTVLSWLADAGPHLENSAVLLVSLDHPVIQVAVDWMEAALAIGEASGDLPQTGNHLKAAPSSAWAALTG
jgi:hypothetical protein